ncbi:hypothetical protein FRC00_006327 [Tulasnella sp. 408]|nr:hypothetical protein FRC00_006327 [Tulasnella sp. 408]
MAGNLLDPADSGPASLPILDFCDQVAANADTYSHYGVLKIEHNKRTSGVGHEFLVVTVVATQIDGNPQTQVCLERGRGRADRWWHPLSSLGPAKDQISRWPLKGTDAKTQTSLRKSRKGVKGSENGSIDDQDLWQISSLRVPNITTFKIRDLCLILRVITNMAPQYDVKDYQSYWFCVAVMELARMALPGLSQESGRDAGRAGKWGEKGIAILDLARAKRNLQELTSKEEQESSNVEALNDAFRKASTVTSSKVLQEANSNAVRNIVAICQENQQAQKRGDEKVLRDALSHARHEAAWEVGVEAMSPISRAFARASRDIDVKSISSKKRWDDRSWVIGSEWRPGSSRDSRTTEKKRAIDFK